MLVYGSNDVYDVYDHVVGEYVANVHVVNIQFLCYQIGNDHYCIDFDFDNVREQNTVCDMETPVNIHE